MTETPASRSGPPCPPGAPDGEAWPRIPGIDGRLPMRTLRGDVDRYVRLLQVFARHHAPDVAMLRSACAPSADASAVRRCLHGLKGSAATIGATDLHALAVTVDARMHQGEAPAAVAAELAQLADGLQRLLEHIGGLPPA